MTDGLGATAISAILGGLGVAASLVATTFLSGWRSRGIADGLAEKIIASANVLRDEMRLDRDEFVKQTGDTFLALREKIRDTELWNRDNFVRRSDFTAAVESFNQNIRLMASQFSTELNKLETKIDKLQDRH